MSGTRRGARGKTNLNLEGDFRLSQKTTIKFLHANKELSCELEHLTCLFLPQRCQSTAVCQMAWEKKQDIRCDFSSCGSGQHHIVHSCKIIIHTTEGRGHIISFVQSFYPKHCYSTTLCTKEVHTSSLDSLSSLPSTNSHQFSITDLISLSTPTFRNPAFRSAQKWLLIHFSILSKFKSTELIKPDRQTRKCWAVCLRASQGHCVLVLGRDVLFCF